jgi:polyisoprenyl-teichoic acid--peptidoglycan teichoic acid transferase
MAVVCVLGIGGSIYAYNSAHAIMLNQPFEGSLVLPAATAQPADAPGAGSNDPAVTATPDIVDIELPKPWNGSERLNILLLGIDERKNDREKFFNTDTMLVLSIDPVTMEAGMLSIPRDLWVYVPLKDSMGRINEANRWGDAYDYPGGAGPNLSRKVVENLLGVRIHHYVRVNFTVFESFVDRLGGIEVDVPVDIVDNDYPTEDYRTETFKLDKGLQTLDGATALKYARTRHDKNGDFGRARRQQQVILAIRDKAKDPRVFASLIAGAPELFAQFGTSIKTDMTLNQMQQLAVLAQNLKREKIKSAVIDGAYTEFAQTPEGWQVLIAKRDKIADLRDAFFTAGVPVPPTSTPKPAQ